MPSLRPDAGGGPDGSGRGEGGLPHRVQSHIGPLDGLRGWAALMVVIAHLSSVDLHVPVGSSIGNYGVLLFFILSGFLMSHLYTTRPMNGERLGAYLAARISRIVPLYFTAVLIGFVVGKLFDPAFPFAMSVEQLVRHLAFVGSVSVFWSIGPEFQFYFLFPILWWVASKPADRAMRWAVPLGFAILVAVVFRSSWPGVLTLSKLHIFLIGVALAPLRRAMAGRLTAGPLLMLQASALVVLLVLLMPRDLVGTTIYPITAGDSRHNAYYEDLGKVFALAWVVFAFTFESRFADTLFANRLMRLAGKYSFSIYLLHTPILYLLHRSGVFGILPLGASLLFILATILAVGALSFRFFEEPSRVAVRGSLIRLFRRVEDGTIGSRVTAG